MALSIDRLYSSTLGERNPMKWKEEYNIGVELIDEQHKKLAGMIGELQTDLPAEEKNRRIGDTLKFLVGYAQKHFAAEEELMKMAKYPDYAYHKELHKKFAGEITAVLVKIKKGVPVQVADLSNFLTGWLANHILKEDKKIGNFINRRRG